MKLILCAFALVGSFHPFAHISAQQQSQSNGLAEVNGTKLYYEVKGKGPAVVLIHGGLVDSRLWDDQMVPLSKHYRVVRYDLRAFGKSASTTEPFSHIEDLRALLDFLKIDRATLVGLSLGGIIAADFALEYPEKISSLVLVGAGLRGDPQPPDIAAYKEAQAAASRGAEAFVNVTMSSALYAAVRPGSSVCSRLRQMALDNFKAVPTFVPGFWKYPQRTTYERLNDINKPTLVIIGSEDSQTLKNIANTLATKIPGASKVIIPGSSHHPPVEKSKEFTRAVLGFLSQKKGMTK